MILKLCSEITSGNEVASLQDQGRTQRGNAVVLPEVPCSFPYWVLTSVGVLFCFYWNWSRSSSQNFVLPYKASKTPWATEMECHIKVWAPGLNECMLKHAYAIWGNWLYLLSGAWVFQMLGNDLKLPWQLDSVNPQCCFIIEFKQFSDLDVLCNWKKDVSVNSSRVPIDA